MKKIILLLTTLFCFGGCATASIFDPVPLNLSPLVLINPIALAVDPAANRLYLVNSNNTVLFADASFVILDITDPVDPQPISVISIPSFSGQIQLDVPRGFVYIPNRLSEDDTDQVDQVLRININEASPTFLQVDSIPSADNPFGAFYDGANTLFVACANEALRYNASDFAGFTAVDMSVTTAQGREIDGSQTRALGLTPSGNFLFVTNEIDNMLILNVNEFPAPVIPGRVELFEEPVDYIVGGTNSTVGIARDSNFVYVVDDVPQTLRILSEAGLNPVVGPPQEISIASLQVAAIPVGEEPGEVVIDEPNNRAYVSNTGSDNVSVIDTALQIEIARIALDLNLPAGVPLGGGPFGMAVANVSGGNYLYVANFDSSNVTIIDTNSLSVVGGFPPP